MKLSKKAIIRIVVGLAIFIGGLIAIDEATTYLVRAHPNDVQVIDDIIIIEMHSGTSVGLFKKAELKEIEEGIYSIDTYYSLLTGEYSGYKYKIDNSDKHIKELRNYDFDDPESYWVLYPLEQ